MTQIPSILELLALSGSQFRLYDIGRKIDKISSDDFDKIEKNQIPYPYPAQGHACIAIAFWQEKTQQSYLWFVKLPLDERGLLNQGARTHFVAIIVEALGSDLSVDPSQQQEELLKNNPYHFTPAQYKLASLNSIINLELKHPASEHYQNCADYFSGKLGWDNWQNIGVQGLADYVSRLSTDNNGDNLINALPHISEQVLTPLCSALENEILSDKIIDALIEKTKEVKNNQVLRAQLLRALASNCTQAAVEIFIEQLITQQELSTDDFITLAARCWLFFSNQKRLMLFLELFPEILFSSIIILILLVN